MNHRIVDKIILGREENFEYDPRYFLQTAERAMKNDIIRGLVELITNADDSYCEIESRRQKTSGEISISIKRQRKDSSVIEVRDRAEGMELREMVNKLKRVGGITSKFLETKGVKTRGLMGRGSKECVVFGKLTFKSIKNDLYSEVQLKKPSTFTPVDKRPVTEFDRVKLEIPKGNGTLVTLEVEPQFSVPSHQSLIDKLPKYYSLRDILANPQRKIELKDINSSSRKTDRLVYGPKEGNLVLDETFVVPDYLDAEAHLSIYKTNKKINAEPKSPYWEGGILIKSNYAIHGITGFTRDIENNPYFEYYFGRLQCPYIDQLAIEYEQEEKQNIEHSYNNPSRVIDPLRSEGLTIDHPFTKALYKQAKKRIKILLKKDEQDATTKTEEIENKKTTKRLNRLATEAGKFIKNHTENLDDIEEENYLEDSNIPSGGMRIVPQEQKIPIGETKKFYVYVKPSSKQPERQIHISTESKAIMLNSDVEGLLKKNPGIFYSSFSVMGMSYANKIKINISWSGIKKQAYVSVVKKENIHPNVKDFSFGKNKYRVKQGKSKEVLILANWPSFIHGEVECAVVSDNEKFIKFTGKKTKLKHIKFDDGVEMGVGKLKVFGKKRGGPTTLKTTLQQKEITTKVFVIPKKELGQDIDIKVVPEDLGEQRTVWDGNLLKIAGRHKSIRRYLGPGPKFSGQDSIHFRLLLAELIANSVANRILEKNSQKNIREYEDLDASSFISRHRRYMNEFLGIAHKIQIPESELNKEK